MSHNDPQPVIKKALGGQWDQLDDLIRRHYDITPGRSSRMSLSGTMIEVYHSGIAKLFLLPGRLFGALVPYKGKDIPTQVKNWTTIDNHHAMYWYRILRFPNKPPVVFRSHMEHVRDDEIIEYVKFGLGIRLRVFVLDRALHFRSLGYLWRLGRVSIPIPAWAILGRAEISERPLTDRDFYIDFTMQHPLFGRTFSYSGTFTIEQTG